MVKATRRKSAAKQPRNSPAKQPRRAARLTYGPSGSAADEEKHSITLAPQTSVMVTGLQSKLRISINRHGEPMLIIFDEKGPSGL